MNIGTFLSRKLIATICALSFGFSHTAFTEESVQQQLSTDDIQLILNSPEKGDASNQYLAGILYQRGEQVSHDLGNL